MYYNVSTPQKCFNPEMRVAKSAKVAQRALSTAQMMYYYIRWWQRSASHLSLFSPLATLDFAEIEVVK